MIRIEKLCKSYAQKKALDNLCLSINGGFIFGLLGPNGAGKTTLISILNGLTPFDSGEVFVFGMPLNSHLFEIRRRCSLIPQSLAFYESLSVIENLNFFAGVQQIKGLEKQKNINYSIEINRLGAMLKQKAGTLSGGQKRRLNIAIGLLNNPDILFFDEPTVGIDPQSRNEILTTIQAFKEENKAVIYTSHYMPEIEKICDQVAIINAGKVIKQGDISSMLATDGQQIIIEVYDTEPALLNTCCIVFPVLFLVSPTTLSLPTESEALLGDLLALFTSKSIKIKHINYASTNLESVFINLTSSEK